MITIFFNWLHYSVVRVVGVILLLICHISLASSNEAVNVENKPNILLIVADDMGYSDLGVFW